jgi:hypothetical protein
LLIAREALQARLPAPPADRSHASLQAWVDDAVVDWIRQRRDGIEQVRQRFELEGRPSDDERIVRDATLGLLHEDTADVLASLPEPAELASEPEITRVYREVLAAQAEPFVSSALLQFRDCAELAYAREEAMAVWAEFCHARFERLKRESLARQGK